MPMTKRVMRGLHNIKTMSGRVDDFATPYKAYMKLSILEMEKYRRNKEKASALARLQTIDQRFQEIEIEKQKAIQSLETQGVSQKCRLRPAAGRSVTTPRTSTGTFEIRY